MSKAVQMFVLIFLGFIVAGCASKGVTVKDVTIRSYMQDRERVDQGETGNEGYIQGKAISVQAPVKTRKVYVVEVSKAVKEAKENPPAGLTSTSQATVENTKEESQNASDINQKISLPSTDQPKTETSVPAMTSDTDYVIEKDDTLQKISKKFYGSYGKWTKIYEVNKDIIKDPNHIKSGLKIKIPKLN